ncbi:hypothetical protein [Methylobacterium sp. CM6247]
MLPAFAFGLVVGLSFLIEPQVGAASLIAALIIGLLLGPFNFVVEWFFGRVLDE